MDEPKGIEQGCPVCHEWCNVEGPPNIADGYNVECPNCGLFAIGFAFYKALREKIDAYELMKAAAVIFERRILETDNPDLHNNRIRMLLPAGYNQKIIDKPPFPFRWDELLKRFPTTLADRLDRCLVLLGRMSARPGVAMTKDFTGSMRRATFSEDIPAMEFALEQLAQAGFVKLQEPKYVILQAKGWNRIADLERERGRYGGKRAFVAMHFSGDQSEKDIKAAVREAITNSGYEPVIVDAIEHNDKICDLIIAEIRKSHFVVADFTGHRQNVYFEAGFAQGLGLTVIRCCQEDEMTKEKTHFDTRQYNHIVWKTPKELSEKLANRIQATV